MPQQKSQATFLLLPLELRLHIYEDIFLCKSQIMPYLNHKPRAEHSIPPSILRTCKQIHREASPILYSKNTFSIKYPQRTFKWLLKIGGANIKLLNTINIRVDPMVNAVDNYIYRVKATASWYKVLDLLAREATGLRHVEINWDALFQVGELGKNLRFVRKLAKIQGLQSMVVDGFYGMHWPRYLTKKMGVTVVEKNSDEPSLQSLRMFQRGTEDLIP